MPFDQTNFVEAPVLQVVRILREGRALIAKPENWNKGRAGANDYCAIHACAMASTGRLDRKGKCDAWDILDANVPPGPWSETISFNDHPDTTHADVLALFDRAIAAAEAQS